MGSDSVMFSVDYPFEKTELAAQFIDGAKISDTDRVKVASENAKRILRIGRRVGRLESALATEKK
jgi:2,3-dihydroxybenzoate decarboxylase